MRTKYPMLREQSEAGVSSGLLLLRVVTGLVFFMHGWQKLFDQGLSGTRQGFEMMGVPLPALSAPVVTFLELIGGLLLMAGAVTPIVGVLLAIDMIVALFLVHIENGFFASTGGIELVLLLAGAALALAIAGPGRYSVDAVLGIPGTPGVARRDDRTMTMNTR